MFTLVFYLCIPLLIMLKLCSSFTKGPEHCLYKLNLSDVNKMAAKRIKSC